MKVFVDADAFVAIMKYSDSNHDKALHQLDYLLSQSAEFLTSNYVFTEVVTVLSQRVGQSMAMQFIKIMRSTISPFTVRWVDQDIEDRALNIFTKQTFKNISFVDCTNMAIIQNDHLDQIFSFDSVYRKNNFTQSPYQ